MRFCYNFGRKHCEHETRLEAKDSKLKLAKRNAAAKRRGDLPFAFG